MIAAVAAWPPVEADRATQVCIARQHSYRQNADYVYTPATASRALADLHGAGLVTSCWGVYLDESPLGDGPVRVLPLRAFLSELAAGRVLAPAPRR